ncbi:MAG: ATP-binding cassette domain-containing protein [Deltaproteobacteria bacterium]|jgi:phospholipid/cholesterol/gamma-HCH transport system ATP-binding protein|nr:ATP-binding cassette domain-containing protein [Deltaproteobacteria bacterium]
MQTDLDKKPGATSEPGKVPPEKDGPGGKPRAEAAPERSAFEKAESGDPEPRDGIDGGPALDKGTGAEPERMAGTPPGRPHAGPDPGKTTGVGGAEPVAGPDLRNDAGGDGTEPDAGPDLLKNAVADGTEPDAGPDPGKTAGSDGAEPDAGPDPGKTVGAEPDRPGSEDDPGKPGPAEEPDADSGKTRTAPGSARPSKPRKPKPGSPGIPAVELEDIRLSFGNNAVLDGFSLSVPPGTKISVVGESSCGKSSLFKVMVGLLRPDSGRARLFGKDLTKPSLRELEKLRRMVGMQFQAGALFDSLDVLRNLSLASLESTRGGRGRPAGSADILDMLDRVGLKTAAFQNPSSLSGGMRKRAAIARALIVNPELALFDEPTAGLDPLTSASIIRLLNSLSADLGAAMLLATTDLDVARRFSRDIVIMHEGKIRARGSVDDHLSSRDPYIVRFLSRFNRLKAAR